MRRIAKVTVSSACALAVWAGSEQGALAGAFCSATSVPTACAATAQATHWQAGLGIGQRVVNQLWTSASVHQDVANWSALRNSIIKVIPPILASIADFGLPAQAKLCREQGLLDGATCGLNDLRPELACVLDPIDWGYITSAMYCELSMLEGGGGGYGAWYVTLSKGICGSAFPVSCENVYTFGATRASAETLLPAVSTALAERGVANPVPSFWQPAACIAYTQGAFANTFRSARTADCAH